MIAFLSTWEIVAVLVVALLLFGHRLPGMARSLGSGITEFKRGLKDGQKPDGSAGQPPTRPDDHSNTGAPR
ncbi:MAG: twin-arginine translocase TatA/TatE family subunit [Planctomycetota bacterium]|jgi:sec-independent protein translocase protein TatA